MKNTDLIAPEKISLAEELWDRSGIRWATISFNWWPKNRARCSAC